jgi:hypothetical protein
MWMRAARQEIIMRKTVGVFVTTALVIAMIGLSMKSAPVTVTAAEIQPSSTATSLRTHVEKRQVHSGRIPRG